MLRFRFQENSTVVALPAAMKLFVNSLPTWKVGLLWASVPRPSEAAHDLVLAQESMRE